jgi:hypothetical protein
MSTICLGILLGLPHLEMSGWGVLYLPTQIEPLEKSCCFSATHQTVWWCTRQRTVACPVRLAVALSEQVTVGAAGFSHRTVWWSSQLGAT